MTTISLSDAESLRSAGLSVLPADRAHKRPAVGGWKQYQTRIATAQELDAWFAQPRDGVCVVCGRVSGNLECLDFDSGGEAFEPFQDLVDQNLGTRLVCERSPSGGCHVFYRCSSPVDGNQKLALAENGGVLIETRGEGGIVLCAPTEGYSLFQGSFSSIPLLSPEERAALLSAARSLDRHAPPDAAPTTSARKTDAVPKVMPPRADGFDLLPGEDFDERGDLHALLEAHGWTMVHGGENEGWKRPGKEGDGQSATWNGSVFYVFSSNALPFESGKGYGKFGVYAVLEHGGDLQAASAALAEKGYGRRTDPTAGVDMADVIKEAEREAAVVEVENPPEPEAEPVKKAEPEDWALYTMPGFVDELAAYTCRTSAYTNRALAFSGALALLVFLCGRSYCTSSGLSPLLYILALADSAVGKQAPRDVNARLLHQFGLSDRLGEEFASGEGLEDSLIEQPCMLYQSDEIAFLFESLKEDDPRSRSISSKLLRLYTSSSGIYSTRVTARKRAGKGGGEEKAKPRTILRPLPVIYGSATPEKFLGALTRDILENGLVGRCLILDANSKRVRNPSPNFGEEPPALIADGIQDLLKVQDGIGSGPAHPVPEMPEANECLAAFADDCDELVNLANSARLSSPGAAPLWGRAWEKAYKLALLHAVSRAPGQPPVILEEDAVWGVAFSRSLTEKILDRIKFHVGGSPFEKLVVSALRLLNRNPSGVTRSELVRELRSPKRTTDEVVDYLIESGQVLQGKIKNPNGANRSAICYRLA